MGYRGLGLRTVFRVVHVTPIVLIPYLRVILIAACTAARANKKIEAASELLHVTNLIRQQILPHLESASETLRIHAIQFASIVIATNSLFSDKV